MNRRPRYAKEVRERAVRLVLTGEHDHSSRWAAIQSVASKIGEEREKIDVDTGVQPGITTYQSQRTKELQREVRELKPSNDKLRKAAAFRPRGSRPQTEAMVDFIDQYHDVRGVVPICKELPIAPSTHHLRIIIIKYVRSIHRGAVHE